MDDTLAGYYSGWETYHRRLCDAIAPLDDAQLDLRAAPHLWPVRTLANHVVAVRAWYFHSWMGEGGPELAEITKFDEDAAAPTRSAADIVKGLEVTWALIASPTRRARHRPLDRRRHIKVPPVYTSLAADS